MSTPAEQHLKDGDPDGALAALQDQIRRAPQDAALRVFLFQLLAIQGDWTRALAQLRMAAMLDPQAESMARAYREAILCEVWRDKVFKGEKTPVLVGEIDPWLAWMVEALRLQSLDEFSAAEDLRARALEAAPAVSGTLNGAPFSWIADADPRLGPVLEIIVDGRCLWAPFSAIRRLSLEAPSDLRDRIWAPAQVDWAAGGRTVALIPARYAGAGAPSPAQRLAAATDWAVSGDRILGGLGQRLLITDADEHALLDLRELTLDVAAPAAAETAEADHG